MQHGVLLYVRGSSCYAVQCTPAPILAPRTPRTHCSNTWSHTLAAPTPQLWESLWVKCAWCRHACGRTLDATNTPWSRADTRRWATVGERHAHMCLPRADSGTCSWGGVHSPSRGLRWKRCCLYVCCWWHGWCLICGAGAAPSSSMRTMPTRSDGTGSVAYTRRRWRRVATHRTPDMFVWR